MFYFLTANLTPSNSLKSVNINSQGQLCLQWQEFKTNATACFRDMREDIDFADVTLSCDDNQLIKCHKVISAASNSPFFRIMLKQNKHPHPLVYMRGLAAKDLTALVDFIYKGEVNVYEDDLKKFLAFAQELQVKGLEDQAPTYKQETSINTHGRDNLESTYKWLFQRSRIN